jgi:hypothetical protein
MGVDRHSAELLLWGRSKGVDFTRVLTLGRMGLHLPVGELASVLAAFGLPRSPDQVAGYFAERDGYAEPFFDLLGAREVVSMDASGFEGATLVHDLNQPIPSDWRERYSVVLDGGTLEHVFNYPVALRNCLEMVAIGGHFLAITPANNYMGHGFYQFSPELYARVLQPENGFQLKHLLLFEFGERRWYEVIDPAKAGGRVRLVNQRPTMLAVMAQRTERVDILARPPQQSDYSEEWSEWNAAASRARTCREAVRQQQSWLKRWLRGAKKWFKPRFPKKHFRPIRLAG